jgi:hypothetical protein
MPILWTDLPFNYYNYDDNNYDGDGTKDSIQSFALYRQALYCLIYASTCICFFPRLVSYYRHNNLAELTSMCQQTSSFFHQIGLEDHAWLASN